MVAIKNNICKNQNELPDQMIHMNDENMQEPFLKDSLKRNSNRNCVSIFFLLFYCLQLLDIQYIVGFSMPL